MPIAVSLVFFFFEIDDVRNSFDCAIMIFVGVRWEESSI